MKRFAWFDCMRCVAILLVMGAHCKDISPALSPAFGAIFTFIHRIGWAGVDLFFVLSGFLVSGLLFDEHDSTGALNIKRFLVRRGFKIIPAFYVLVLITAIYDAIAYKRIVVVHLLHDIFFLQSYRAGAWPHAWTLAIEVHFYILLALLLYYLSRMPSKNGQWLTRLPAIICGALIASFLARLLNSELKTGFNLHREIEPSHLHLDVLAAGVLLRYLYNYHHEALAFLQRGKALWVGLALLFVYPSELLWTPHPKLLTALIPTLNYMGFAVILFVITQIPFPTSGVMNWLTRPFDYFGKHSYSIYLWHLPVKEWIVDPLMKGPPGALYLVVFVITSLVMGTLLSELLEMPILHLRNQLFPSNARSVRNK